ncbi:MAG: septum formation protein Maf [Polyangiaceae bacterium]|nr:septum formation protein Maf [Polyangiaceae bacterium]
MSPLQISAQHPLLLGSGSPRRRELLSGLGIPLELRVASVDERVGGGEAPAGYLRRVVGQKLSAATAGGVGAAAGVLVADTIVVVDDAILGKPCDDDEALEMLRRIAGRWHSVLTNFAIATRAAPHEAASMVTVSTRVFVREVARGELERYVASREGKDKAGAYAIQGVFAHLVQRIDGSYTNVVGLPLCEVVLELRRLTLLGELPVRGA